MNRTVQFLKAEYCHPGNTGKMLGLAEHFSKSGQRGIQDYGLDLMEYVKMGFLRRASMKPGGDRKTRGRK